VDLSICLPLYQQKPFETVKSLIKQAEELKVNYEVLIIDDASKPTLSATNAQYFSNFPTVRYIILEHNIGRAKIRNRLAAEAQGDYRLCLDGDTLIDHNDFIKLYWDKRESAMVIIGGLKLAPLIPRCELRWFYANKREAINCEERQLKPYSSFMTGNFFCKGSLFETLQFDENIKGYGHEDTLFGFGLEKLKISILHLNNPILFAADDRNSDFLIKSKEALENLKTLSKTSPALEQKIGILKLGLKMQRYNLGVLFIWAYYPLRKMIYKNLLSSKPSLFFFDLYRLNYLLT